MRQQRFLGMAVVLWLLSLAAVRAENWPAWRGPTGSGLSTEKNVPLRWSEDENVYWKVEIPGVGHSSPIVWESSIFVTTCVIEDRTRRLLCIDRETGDILWNQVVATAPIEKMHRDNTPASATPITDGQRIFTAFCVDGRLQVSAVSFSGQQVWKVFPGAFESRHGFCTGLVLDGNRLFLSGLQDGPDAFLAALDTDNGATLWKVSRPHQVRSFSTPYLCQVKGEPAILLSGASQTIAYERTSGSTIWELDGPAEKTVSSIVSCDQSGLAFVCGGRDNGFLAVALDGSPEDQPAASARSDSQLISWTTNKSIPYMTSPLVCRGLLHILSDEGVYRCYETKTGRVVNELRGVGPVRASMVATPDRIYITEKQGRTTVIANNSDWQVLSVNEIGEEVMASAAISGGDFVLRTLRHLVLIRDTSPMARRKTLDLRK